MSKTIFTVHLEIPGSQVEKLDFQSKRSLLDADIIALDLSFFDTYLALEDYDGLPLLSDTDSFKVFEQINHWRAEINAALESGKTVIVFLSLFKKVYRYTGQRNTSGSGRNQKITKIVDTICNYDVLPLTVRPVAKSGKEIRTAGDLGFLAGYWKEFAPYSQYEVVLEEGIDKPLLTTKGGEKTVGGLVKKGTGTLLLLPEIYWDEDEFLEEDVEKDTWEWSGEGIAFGKRLVRHFVEFDKSVRSSVDISPEPEWVTVDNFRLAKEAEVETKILEIAGRIQKLNDERKILHDELANAKGLKRLLYEKGRELEHAVIDALRLMEFKADGFVDEESEFDCVFVSSEGRFLGEAEGKDSKAINIEKLSQLERNIQEDFSKEGVDEYAKGVLFGNAFRLSDPAERGEYFTQKCLKGAERAKFALVRTPDLFRVAQYLIENNDPEFADKCRKAVLETEGEIVSFPSPPKVNSRTQKKLKVSKAK